MAVSDLVFVSTIAELQHIDKLYPSLLAPNSMAVTPEFGVAMMLALQGKPWCSLFDFLTPQEQIANVAEAWQLVRNWWRPWLESVDFEGVVLANVMETDLFYPLLASINAAQAVGRVLQEQRPQHVFVFDDAHGPWIYGNGGPFNRVINAVVRWWSNRLGIDVHLLNPPPPMGPRDTRGRGDRSQDGKASHYENTLTRYSGRPIILGIVDRYDLLRQGKLPAALADCDEFSYVQLCLSARHMLGGGRYATDYPVVDLEKLLRWPAPSRRVDRQLGQAWSAFQEARQSFTGSREVLFANPYLDFQYRDFWNNLRHGARLIQCFGQAVETLRPVLCLFQDDFWGWRRCLIETARQRGIPTLGLVHGGMLSPVSAPMSINGSDSILAWGEMDRAVLVAAGQPPERIALVGSPVYNGDYQARCQLSPWLKDAQPRQHLLRQLGLGEQRPVVFVLSSPISGLGYSLANTRSHIECWRAVAQIACQLPDVEFLVKPHPNKASGDWEALQQFCTTGPPNLRFLDHVASLGDILPIGDAALLVDAPTTAGVEAMLHHLPTVYVRTARLKPEDGFTSPLDEGGPLIVDDLSELSAAIQRVLFEPRERKLIADQCSAFSIRFIGVDDLSTTERVFVLISKKAIQPATYPDPQGLNKLQSIAVLGKAIRDSADTRSSNAIEDAAREVGELCPISNREQADLLVWLSREAQECWSDGQESDAYLRDVEDLVQKVAALFCVSMFPQRRAVASAFVAAGHQNFQKRQYSRSARCMGRALWMQPSLLWQDRGVVSVLARSIWRLTAVNDLRHRER